jgi:hypothetical protein
MILTDTQFKAISLLFKNMTNDVFYILKDNISNETYLKLSNEHNRINSIRSKATEERRLLTLEESTSVIIAREMLRRELFDTILKL